jgi:hypothetical protein
MYKILHIPTGNYVKDGTTTYMWHKGQSYGDLILETIPEDSFDRADLIRNIIFSKIHYGCNSDIKKACHSIFSEFVFVEVNDV